MWTLQSKYITTIWIWIFLFFMHFNIIKRKLELSKNQRKRIYFIIRLKYAEHKIFCICIGVHKVFEGKNYDKIYEVLSSLKNKKWKINKIVNEKNEGKCENPEFDQDYFSRTSTGVYNIGHASIRLTKWLAYYDRSYYENINYYDLMGSILKYLNEIS